ncbi:hypothetical protein QTI05_24150 [Variovorax sp. J22R193]|uniref:hypothetical protein n=1 Tax=Variovorax fucosicus TaxID=3053517 RepID=UPI002576D095|nr:hypothetical protein [Variovorax sp. J22R193]MDM0042152.1 hypothetical protein [Variovorax sp. J22R193]
MKTIHFYDKVKELAGVDEHPFEVNSPLELINALTSQIKGFRELVRDNELIILSTNEDKSEYEYVSLENFQLKLGKLEHVHVMSVVEGSGIETAIAALGYGAFATAVITIAVNIAISFVVSAIVKSLAPSPDTSEGTAEAASRPSFIYNGAKLVYEQGYAIPLIYGIHMSGGIVIYTDLVIEDIPYVPAEIAMPTYVTDPAAGGRGELVGRVDYQFGGGGP